MGWKSSGIETFAGRVRAAARQLGLLSDGTRIEFSAADLSHAAGVQTIRGTKKLHWAIRDMKEAGELISVRKGVYRLADGARESKVREKREVMWRFLRIRGSVTVGELQEAAGVSEEYAGEWLQMLKRRGIVKPTKGGRLRLMVDSAEAPHDLEKAEKLRKLRAERKNRLESAIDEAQIRITEAGQLLDEARDALSTLLAVDSQGSVGTAHPTEAVGAGEGSL
jgi:predicted transcriptional regulator